MEHTGNTAKSSPTKSKLPISYSSLTLDSLSEIISVRLFALICLVIPLLYWPPAFDAAGLPREMLLAVCAGLGLFFSSFGFIQNSASHRWHLTMLLMLALLAWAGASYFWSVDKGSSLLGIMQFSSLIFLALVATQISYTDIMDYILPMALIAATLAGLIGIAQYFGFRPLDLRQLASPASTFVNVNYAANYFDLITPVALAALLIQDRQTTRLALLAATAFTASLGFQVISQCRGSWLGLVVIVISTILLCLLRPDFKSLLINAIRRHRWALIVSLLVVIGIVVIGTAFTKPSVSSHDKLETITSLTPDMSIKLRLDFYQNALVGFFNHPWKGVGYGAFIMGFSPYIDAVHPITIVNQNSIIGDLHSDPLQMFFELGVPGGLLSLSLYLMVIFLAWRIIRSSAPSSQRLLGFGLMLALLACGAHAWVDFPLHLPTSAFFFWFWSGLVIGLYLTIYPVKSIKFSRFTAIAIGFAGLAFTAYATYLYAGYLHANRDVRTAMVHAIHNDCPAVFKLTDRAMNNFGLDHLTRFWYAKVYTYCEAPVQTKLRAMNRILALDPNMPLPYLTRAQLELKKGELESAASDFNTYRKLLSHEPQGYIGLAQIASQLNQKSQVHYWLNQAYLHVSNKQQLKLLVEQLKF